MKYLLIPLAMFFYGCALLSSDEEAACSWTPLTSPSLGDASTSVSKATAMSAQRGRADIDDQLAGVARDVPGFGGHYFDGPRMAGYLNIYLLSPDQAAAEAAQKRLASIYNSERIAQAPVRAVVGDYSYDQLLAWYRELQGGLGSVSGLVFTDIAEDENRLSIGISTKGAQDRVIDMLERLEIPREAVNLEISEPIRPLDGC